MILAPVIWWQFHRSKDCSPVHWVDIDFILASDMWTQLHSYECTPVQWVDIDMMLVFVMCSQSSRSNECNPVQWVDIAIMQHLLSEHKT